MWTSSKTCCWIDNSEANYHPSWTVLLKHLRELFSKEQWMNNEQFIVIIRCINYVSVGLVKKLLQFRSVVVASYDLLVQSQIDILSAVNCTVVWCTPRLYYYYYWQPTGSSSAAPEARRCCDWLTLKFSSAMPSNTYQCTEKWNLKMSRIVSVYTFPVRSSQRSIVVRCMRSQYLHNKSC